MMEYSPNPQMSSIYSFTAMPLLMSQGFSKLIMLYHPNRADYHKKEIIRLAAENSIDRLLEYSHILK